jgi:signal transduction histidine kinase
MPGPALRDSVRAELLRRSAELRSRWAASTRAVDVFDGTDATSNDAHRVVDTLTSSTLVHALVTALAREDETRELIAEALQFGAAASAARMSLHHTIKAAGLLTSVVLDAIDEMVRAPGIGTPLGTAAEGIQLASVVHRASALVTLTVVRGHMQSEAESLRQRFRHLRHDLRNPLGTIKSVLALMDDESVPIESRANPGFRAIASRNARSLEEMISLQLGDAALPLTFATGQETSLGAVIDAVRRELRPMAERRGVTIDGACADIRAFLDVPALEVLLYAVLAAVVAESARGECIALELVERTTGHLAVRVHRESGRAAITEECAAESLVRLAQRMGGVLTVDDDLNITLALRGERRSARVAEDERRVRPQQGHGSVGGQARDDVGGAREGENGEAGTL